MPDLDLGKLAQSMTDAAKGSLGEDWPAAKRFVESEAKKFAQNLADIARQKAAGEIEEEDAQYLIEMHKRSMKMVLTAGQGISLIMAERAINAALGAIRNAVNGVIGWKLL